MRTQITLKSFEKIVSQASRDEIDYTTETKVIGLRTDKIYAYANGVKMIVASRVGSKRSSYYIAFTSETSKAAFEMLASAGVGLGGGYGIGTMV